MSEFQFSTIPQAVDAIANGKVVIVVDDENRENEGDFICAAELATPENMNLLMSAGATFACPFCLKLVNAWSFIRLSIGTRLHWVPPFVTPLDHVTAKTGITAEERATCVRAIADPSTRPNDFVRPGHVHLLVAKPGGVLRRAGHTEAAVDLAKMRDFNLPASCAKFWMRQAIERPAISFLKSQNNTTCRLSPLKISSLIAE